MDEGNRTILVSASRTTISETVTKNGTQDGTVNPESGAADPELDEITAAWRNLPDGIRMAILQLVKANSGR
jgi:hypothetical protein